MSATDQERFEEQDEQERRLMLEERTAEAMDRLYEALRDCLEVAEDLDACSAAGALVDGLLRLEGTGRARRPPARAGPVGRGDLRLRVALDGSGPSASHPSLPGGRRAGRWPVKRYRGYRTGDDRAFVNVHYGEGSVGPLTHHRKHTPAGFEWGYLGSGPAELARCLIIDHLGERAWCAACEGTGISGPVHRHGDTLDPDQCWVCMGEGTSFQPVVYQSLKFEIVAMWGDRWELRADALALFLGRFDGRGGGSGVLHLQGVTVPGPRLERGDGST